jgi:hypothetical protein
VVISELVDRRARRQRRPLLPARQRRKRLQVSQNMIALPTFYSLEECKIPPHWVLFYVHIDKLNGYQELFQFLITAAQVSEVEVPDKHTPPGWHQFKCKVLVGAMCKCCKDANWREQAVKTCSLKIQDAITLHPDFVDKSEKSKEIQHLLSGT